MSSQLISCNVAPLLPLSPSDISAVVALCTKGAVLVRGNKILGTCGFSAAAVEEVNFGGGGRLGLVCSTTVSLSSDFSSSITFGRDTFFFDRGGLAGGISPLLETDLNFI